MVLHTRITGFTFIDLFLTIHTGLQIYAFKFTLSKLYLHYLQFAPSNLGLQMSTSKLHVQICKCIYIYTLKFRHFKFMLLFYIFPSNLYIYIYLQIYSDIQAYKF